MPNEFSPEELFSQAIKSYRNGELVLAEKQFKEIIDRFPDSSEAYRSGDLLGDLKGIGSPDIGEKEEKTDSSKAGKLGKRYRDAYRVASGTIFWGQLTKILGVISGVVGIIGAILIAEESILFAVVAGVFGVSYGVLTYLVGISISAQGQSFSPR